MIAEPLAAAAVWEERVMRAAHPVAYRWLNSITAPVTRVPGLGVIVTDAALLRSVILDTDHFTKKGRGGSSDLWTPVLGPSVVLNMEGADHAALRRQLAPLFAPAFVENVCARSLAPALANLASRLAAGDSVDIVAEVRHFASLIIGELVGLDTAIIDDELFTRISSITGFVKLTRPRLTPRQVATARGILAELDAAATRAYEADDSTVPGRMRALGLSREEALGAVGAFVLTGTETLVSYIPRLIALLADSGWAEGLRDEPALVEAAIAEGLRVTTPSPVMLRSVSAATHIGRVSVREGDRVILATFAANKAFGPFDPTENVASTMKQLWFGAGAHFCLGAPLAMAQIRLVVDTVLAAPGPIEVVSRAPARAVLIPGYSELIVRAARR